ncbi:hypothetical protein ABPG74_010430 [Tetrahymena malaccensis]
MIDLYDFAEKGIDYTQTLYRILQPAPPQIMDQQPSEEKQKKKQNKYSYDSSDSESDNSIYDDDDDDDKSSDSIQFFYNSFVKLVQKKNIEFKMTSDNNKNQMLYAKLDVKNNQWLIYMLDPKNEEFNEQDPQFYLQIRQNKKEWVLWNNSCEQCYQKKQCQPYTNRRQWLMFIMHDIEKQAENAVHVLQILIPRSDDDLRQEVICPRTMDKKQCKYDYNDNEFSYFEFQSKDTNLPDECYYVRTKFPSWSQNLKSWVIDSYGRIKSPSKRNFQLLFDQVNFQSETNLNQQQYEDKDYFPIFQMGKTSSCNYIVDYRHPFSFVQAFAIALCTSSWRSKLK